MEDAHLVLQQLPAPAGEPSWRWPQLAVFAVYDGHAGAEASDFARRRLHEIFARRLSERISAGAAGACATGSTDISAPVAAAVDVSELCGALREAFVDTDAEFCASTLHNSGTTAVVAVCTGTHLVVANAGDSRAYVWRQGQPLELSVDHKPDRADEQARICEAGGFVARGRVLHSLAVSRAIGDREYKQVSAANDDSGLHFKAPLVTAEPEVRVCRVAEGDQLLLACDGLWEVLTADKAFNFLHAAEVTKRPHRAVRQLVTAAEEEYRSTDNITAVFAVL
uniref:PPM-type phosphatase domain-containing protein n=1 Tax=Calcidiscus leptoporus TaxID=127549 RepID=A0A6U5EYW0_9EUKA